MLSHCTISLHNSPPLPHKLQQEDYLQVEKAALLSGCPLQSARSFMSFPNRKPAKCKEEVIAFIYEFPQQGNLQTAKKKHVCRAMPLSWQIEDHKCSTTTNIWLPGLMPSSSRAASLPLSLSLTGQLSWRLFGQEVAGAETRGGCPWRTKSLPTEQGSAGLVSICYC